MNTSNNNVVAIFGKNQETQAQAIDYSQAKEGTTHWNVPTIATDDIGATLTEQIESKGLFYNVVARNNSTTDNNGNTVSTGMKTIFNASSNKPLSVQGEGYKIVDNRHLTTNLLAALNQSDIDLTNAFTRTRIDNDGSKMRLEIILPSTSFDVSSNPSVRDEVALSITATNSFDGSGNFSIKCSAYRFICANGMVSAKPVIEYKQKHTQALSVEKAVKVITCGVEAYQNDKADFMQQVKTDVSFQTVYEALAIINKIDTSLAPTYEEYQRVIRPTLKRQPIIEHHMALWSKYKRELGASQWALNNVLTHISTHGNKPQYSESQSVNGRNDKEKLVHKALKHMLEAA
ncbi:MAG: DUF945 domain-containing protein [Desulfobacterales bacterium]|nr:DUF945 domain-containing protein [Desulfobacterales bacterium]